ncbi:MAG: spore coat protein CotJB [Oscillospiraceae bacterium]|nr:spore coat protein CotJB [Oscillospiraceae bacterium]
MRTQKQLLSLIQRYEFALYDLQLYLDTHTQSREAIALFDKYRSQREQAIAEYTRRFGPLQAIQNQNPDRWEWAKGPYPWEKEAN